MIHLGDCVAVMATLEPDSIDAIVTDPPYGLEFMGKEWDRLWNARPHGDDNRRPTDADGRSTGLSRWDISRPQYRAGAPAQAWHERWATEAYRVAKPGAYLLAFGGTRTCHRLAAAIEDAGWEIRDTLVWAYASGFPKSLNLTGDRQGWGTALKPAWEPIVMARKPLVGTVAANVLRYGTGALNIDATRIPTEGHLKWSEPRDMGYSGGTDAGSVPADTNTLGRWPANVILTDPIFDGGVEGVVGGGEAVGATSVSHQRQYGASSFRLGNAPLQPGYGDSGTYSRFFLVPKSSRSDREPVLGGLAIRPREGESAWAGECNVCGSRMMLNGKPTCGHADFRWVQGKPRANSHPTVKPTDLMRHLVRLVTPPGGTVLDPFLGSGTTALAAELEGFPWLGIEREAEYVAIAEARLNGTQRGLGLSA